MKTLDDHTLIYDQDCPMCRVYTGAFIRGKWLDVDGRRSYQQVDEASFSSLDPIRAQDEIALINRKTGAVTYGLASLTKIITHRFPQTRWMLEAKVVRWMLEHIYAFISYNRKVIAAVKPTGRSCTPSFSLSYRVAYLVFAWIITSLILTKYARLMSGIVPAGTGAREYLIAGGQLIFQGIVIKIYKRKSLFDYWGNMMTVSLMGALALLPALTFGQCLHAPIGFLFYFLLIAGCMLLEHLRRMKLLGLGFTPSITWVTYRLIVVGIILLL